METKIVYRRHVDGTIKRYKETVTRTKVEEIRPGSDHKSGKPGRRPLGNWVRRLYTIGETQNWPEAAYVWTGPLHDGTTGWSCPGQLTPESPNLSWRGSIGRHCCVATRTCASPCLWPTGAATTSPSSGNPESDSEIRGVNRWTPRCSSPCSLPPTSNMRVPYPVGKEAPSLNARMRSRPRQQEMWHRWGRGKVPLC